MSTAPRDRLRDVRLYALVTERHCRRPWLETARMLIEGGADVIQLREKELEGRELLERACRLRELTREQDVIFIVNDRLDVALLSGADGVHLGQDDLPPERVREAAGADIIVGLSTHAREQAAAAQSRGADYVGVGPVYPTRTKGYDEGGGARLVAELCAATRLPTVAIGGITPENAAAAIRAGAQAVAACGALCSADDPRAAARAFLEAVRGGEGSR